MTDPDMARFAAIDQELAALDERLDRASRAVMFGDAGMVIATVILIAFLVAAQPVVYWWEVVVALAAVVLAVAGGFVQGLMLRNYRAEIRDLRSRAG